MILCWRSTRRDVVAPPKRTETVSINWVILITENREINNGRVGATMLRTPVHEILMSSFVQYTGTKRQIQNCTKINEIFLQCLRERCHEIP